MSANFDALATVEIDIRNPVASNTSFDSLLIIGPPPATAGAPSPEAYGEYTSLSEVADFWASTDPVYKAAQIAFMQNPRPERIFIAPTSATTSTDIEAFINQVLEYSSWYVLCPAGIPAAVNVENETDKLYEKIAQLIETSERMFVYTELGDTATAASGARTVTGEYVRTAGIYGKPTSTSAVTDGVLTDEDDEMNNYINVAFVTKWLSYTPGSETAAFKELVGLKPSVLKASEMNNLEKLNLNYFIEVGNRKVSMNGMVTSGEWMDIARFRDWLKNDMQMRVVNLFLVNPKVPYTDSGIAMVQNQMLASLKAGQDAGGIADDEFDENDERIPGYITSVPRASSVSAAQKATRKLIDCKFTARLAGAIHHATIKGNLVYEL